MKKIIISITVFFLCVAVGYAQKMDKATFEHLVDYVNCQYLMTFIEKYDAGKPYIKDTYEKTVKPVLQTATLDNLNNVPDFEKVKGLFANNSNSAALQLAEKINKRKTQFNECPDNSSLVEALSTTGWKNVDLAGTATKIQNNIRTKFNAEPKQATKPVSEQEVVKNQTIQTSSQVDELQAKIVNLQQQYDNLKDDSKLTKLQGTVSMLRLLVIICLALIVVLIATLYLWYKLQFDAENDKSKLKNFIKTIVLHSSDISQKFGSNSNNGNNNVRMFEDKLNKLERQFGELSEKVRNGIPTNSKQQTPQQTNNTPQPTNDVSVPIPPKDDSQYFSSKNKKNLINPTDKDGAKFRVFNIKGNEADFEYCGGVTNLDFFENVCEFDSNAYSVQNKTNISTIEKGKVKKDSDGNWEVSNPAKIKVS
jgi:hypothetical protein